MLKTLLLLCILRLIKQQYFFGSSGSTAIFIMVVSPAVLAHDVSAYAGDVSMGITALPIGWNYSVPFEKLGDG